MARDEQFAALRAVMVEKYSEDTISAIEAGVTGESDDSK
jgi:hypothetical protein